MTIARHLARLFLLAREQGIGLYLDIKTKGIAPLLLEVIEREGMLECVVFGGEWEDVRALYPNANHDAVAYRNPAGKSRNFCPSTVAPGAAVKRSVFTSKDHSHSRLAGDHESLPLLRKLQESDLQNKVLIAWAIGKIEVLRFQPWTN